MRLHAAAAILMMLASPAFAAPLPAPTGDVVLTVSGNIDNAGPDGTAKFDLAMLEALEQRTTTTVTPWYDSERTFSGPLASAVLDAVGAHGTVIRVTAINDYSADIPIEDLTSAPVILATTINGTYMSVRDKGPLFVIYPFDLDHALYNEAVFGKSVWQVVALEVQ